MCIYIYIYIHICEQTKGTSFGATGTTPVHIRLLMIYPYAVPIRNDAVD